VRTRDASVVVVLAAYNGSRFIRDQIQSIRQQTWTDWKLLLRDDSSTDGTVAIARELAAEDDRITVLPPDGQQLGAWGSFALLAERALGLGAGYFLLSDQDDVWLPEKIERSIEALRDHEAVHGRSRAALVHSDLHVVAENLASMHQSYREYQGVSYDRREPLRTLLLHNAPMGCTIACTRALLEFAVPFPEGVAHDWWVAQCAAAAGDVLDIEEPLVLYRQHGSNVVGSPGRRFGLKSLLTHPFTMVPRLLGEFRHGLRQSRELSRRVAERAQFVDPARAAAVEAYADAFSRMNPIRRLARIRQSRVRPQRAVAFPIFYALALSQPPLRDHGR